MSNQLCGGRWISTVATWSSRSTVTAEPGSTGATDPSAQPAKGPPGIRREIRRGAIKVVTDTLGVSRADLRTALKGGQSISEYATSLGKDPQTVVDALTNAANTK